MKKCNKCGETKELSEFYIDRAMKDGRKNYCTTCQYKRTYAHSKKANQYGREVLTRLKLMKGCVHCGYNAHPAALEFNHKNPKEKLFHISNFAKYIATKNTTKSKAKIKMELSKCEVVCAICHNIITFEQRKRNWA